ncbi:MAG: 5-formyltetrahydrofolate cyclo-ligase [Clostridiales Family XIII bacterium]|jgi:5-formyltetrahydrofolate cyclo-ligase|nr:5-formyltetrahydrofolate cyclo-ligase [Clostridiales Family XIII bacterium]
MHSKKELRHELLAAYRAAPIEYLEESAHRIITAVLASAEYAAAQTLFTYVGVDREIHTRPLIHAALADGKTVCVPKTHPHGIMDAVRITGVSRLVATPRGLFEPLEPADGHADIIPPGEISLVILPCLSCDPFGNRVGYGGGYYDRYLKKTTRPQTKILAVCRKKFISQHLPRNENDVRADGCFTESGLFLVPPRDF